MAYLVPIKVEAYSGYKAEERPLAFELEGRRLEIEDIVDRWYQGEGDPVRPCADYYKVRTRDKTTFIIKHVRGACPWYLVRDSMG